MKVKFWFYLVGIILAAFYFYLPVLNFNFVDLPILLIACLLILIFTQLRSVNLQDIKNIGVQIAKKIKSVKIFGYAMAALLIYILFMQFIISPKTFRRSKGKRRF
jgi:hypothetical protein